MLKKALQKLTKKESSPKRAAPSPARQAKILTAEGWKRLMMKKYRK